jgi:hypothetical protein
MEMSAPADAAWENILRKFKSIYLLFALNNRLDGIRCSGKGIFCRSAGSVLRNGIVVQENER